jgi:hypothetical protein
MSQIIDNILKEKLLQTNNEKFLIKNIKNFIGNNCCEKCYISVKYPLKNVISFDKSNGDYQFHDLPGANYILKKFCKKCCYSKTSSAKIYIEL